MESFSVSWLPLFLIYPDSTLPQKTIIPKCSKPEQTRRTRRGDRNEHSYNSASKTSETKEKDGDIRGLEVDTNGDRGKELNWRRRTC